jgi:hypothetical protein
LVFDDVVVECACSYGLVARKPERVATMIFLTGDRSLDPVLSFVVANSMLMRLQTEYEGITPQDIATGDLSGFEAAVRYLVPEASVVSSVEGSDGRVDLDERHGRVRRLLEMSGDGIAVWFVHPDPLDSRVFKSLCGVFGDEELRVMTI